jgi:DDE superfamily endonuclease
VSAQGWEDYKELIEDRGCELLYLPPYYSPDFNPIEQAFSKIKGILRRAEARTREALIEAMGPALSAVSARDARGFFGHSVATASWVNCYDMRCSSSKSWVVPTQQGAWGRTRLLRLLR